MLLSTALLIGGGLIGGGAGFSASKKRAYELDRQFRSINDQAAAKEKMARAQKSILAGNLSIAAIDANASTKNAAVSVYQAESAARAAMAGSNLTEQSTPAYKLATDAIEQRAALGDYMQRAVMGIAQMGLEAEATGMALDAEVSAARNALMDIGAESSYADSAFADIMGTLTGAFSGVQATAGLMSLGVDAGLLSEDMLSKQLFGQPLQQETPYGSDTSFNSLFFNPNRNADPSYTKDLSNGLNVSAPIAPSWTELYLPQTSKYSKKRVTSPLDFRL